MRTIVRECVNKVKPYIPGKPIEEVERELGVRGVMKLASNENALGPSPRALRAISETLRSVHRYPDGSCYYLKKALAKFLSVKEENLVMGNGSDEIITLAVKAFVNEGDEVVIAKPTFLIYEIASQLANAKIRLVPARNFRYDLKAMKDAVSSKTKMVFIANPDNPMGTYVTRDDLAEFFAGLSSDVVVFLDEAYFEFAREFPDYPNGLDYLKKPNVVVARTFSKAYGLAGLRVGYGVSNPELAGFLERVREPFNVNLLAQVAARAALGDRAFLKKTLEYVKNEKSYLYSALRGLNLKYVESATNFVLVDVGKDSRDVFERLLKKGVIVRDMKAWGFDTCIRVTVGTRAQNMKLIKALEDIRK
jgi:histidinol-phosphate aminotransferase